MSDCDVDGHCHCSLCVVVGCAALQKDCSQEVSPHGPSAGVPHCGDVRGHWKWGTSGLSAGVLIVFVMRGLAGLGLGVFLGGGLLLGVGLVVVVVV